MPNLADPLAACLAALVAISGCIEAPATLPHEDPAFLPTATVPAPDMAAFMADYEAYVTQFPDRAGNGPDHLAAREHMAQWFEGLGLTAWRHEFEDGIRQANVIGIKWGTLRDQWVVVGAHYDTYHIDCRYTGCAGAAASQGAYDDGSGTAMVLHLAKLYAKLETPYTIAFALFDGEERGLQGSAALAAALMEGSTPFGNVTARAMLNADMYGLTWPGVQTPVEFLHTSEALRAAVEAARKELGVPDGMMAYGDAAASGGSDFASFAEFVPTGFFSSNMGKEGVPGSGAVPAATPTLDGTYPFWHLADTWQTMLLMAGGPAALESGFETALKLLIAGVHGAAGVPGELDHTAA